jgi:ribose-phosphate pyrophosphokinase
VQPTSSPVNDHLVELLALADACRPAGASRITAILPFFGYGPADKGHGKRESIMGAGGHRSAAACWYWSHRHSGFALPADRGFLSCSRGLPDCRSSSLPGRARSCACQSRRGIAGRRAHGNLLRGAVSWRLGYCPAQATLSGSEANVTHVVGEVSGRASLIVDDMISTGGTVAESITALLAAGARGLR